MNTRKIVEIQENISEIIEEEKKESLCAGDDFSRVRKERNLSLQEISQTLRISQEYLEAIETMSLSRLPEKVYTLGFVRSYATLLGQNPQEAVDRFKKHLYQERSLSFSEIQKNSDRVPPQGLPPLKLVIITLIIIVCISTFWYAIKTISPEIISPADQNKDFQKEVDRNNFPKKNPDQNLERSSTENKRDDMASPDSQKLQGTYPIKMNTIDGSSLDIQADVQLTNGENSVDHKTTPSNDEILLNSPEKTKNNEDSSIKNTPGKQHILQSHLSFKNTSWVQIKDEKGKELLNKNFLPGQRLDLSPYLGAYISVGNGGGVLLNHPSGVSCYLGKENTPIRHIPLDDHHLSQYCPSS